MFLRDTKYFERINQSYFVILKAYYFLDEFETLGILKIGFKMGKSDFLTWYNIIKPLFLVFWDDFWIAGPLN